MSESLFDEETLFRAYLCSIMAGRKSEITEESIKRYVKCARIAVREHRAIYHV